jgi:cell division protein FtsB
VRWDRVGRVALVLVLFGVLVSYLNPVVNLIDAWRDSNSSKERLTKLREENTSLKGQLQHASSPAALEREARKMGMVKPGERLYVIEN